MATSEAALSNQLRKHAAVLPTRAPRRLDKFFIAGVAIALGATFLGIRSSGISIGYFLQPSGAVVVLGGTLGVILVTTPPRNLMHSLRRVTDLIAAVEVDREALIEEIIGYARTARRSGILSLEPIAPKASDPLLRSALQLAVDVSNREELQTVLEAELRMAERQGEADAKTLEVAGGFAPTLGIIGTVIGLIEVLRQFSNPQAVGYGIGTAFVSTIYGLALANLLLLPAAHRIRARVAENFETQELILDGVLSIVDMLHPALIRMRLASFLREPRSVTVAPGAAFYETKA
ncbi:MAG: MotA/TolQ/ExbB proton channel family protein [Acidobacteriia bacterium]|nr:MotA/TolQ/ExbB proton channel family protein [Terriglobia bacterium]